MSHLKFSLILFSLATAFSAQNPNLIRSGIDEGRLATVGHSMHPSARSDADLGAAPDSLAMNRMLLVLKRSPERQAALDKFLEELQQPYSPNYHKWLTPEQFGEQYGATDGDIQVVTAWLQSHGFQVAPVAAGRGVIEFSGNAGQVRSAFHTQMHKFNVGGKEHWANASDQQIPAALGSAVVGVATLHNFRSAPQSSTLSQSVPLANPQFTTSSGNHYLSPADYATIYNVNPLYPSVTGAGVTIAVVGRSNIKIQDVISFRSLMGLPANPPNIIVNGPDPGDLGGGEEAEAVLDTTWAGALATGATVDFVVSGSTNTTDGVNLSEVYIINNNLGSVMTESFGSCEAAYTSSQAALVSSNAQQAAAQGITYTVSTGDNGSAGCDNFNTQTSATGPVSVNALASTPYTVAVGGTQFFENGSTSYWATSNTSTYKSALSYIPEDVWNANCVGTTCSTGSILAGSGGASKFFAKPSWQSGVAGIPADGARDIPDVSLTAAGHDAYLLCLAGSCSASAPTFSAIYGTSAAAPSFASIVALINQKTGTRLGQITPRLYALAATQTLSACNASNTSGLPAANCIFNDVTVGQNAVPGQTGYNTASATYLAGVGFDLASGLGSVNVTNLVNNWAATVSVPTAGLTPATLTFSSQTIGSASGALNVTLSNSGSATLSISGIAISGTNASDFSSTNNCGSSVTAGGSCTISVVFTPGAIGSRTANLVVTDNSGNVSTTTQTTVLNGTGSSSPTPTNFTTYLGTYGSGQPAYTGAATVLPLRAYLPGGASQISYLLTNLTALSGGALEYQIVAQSDGAGNYTLRVSNGSVVAPAWPYPTMSASGSTVTLSTPIAVGALQITAYRFALAGNEFQLDLTVTRSDSFNDQIVILGVQGNNVAYSSPWNAVDGTWSGSSSGSPAVTLSAASLNFGSQPVGASATQTLTVTNSGTAALSISSAAVSGTNASDFTLVNNCTSSVSAGAKCTIAVTFVPPASGARSATLTLTDNAAGSPHTVALSGTGSTSVMPTVFTTYLGTYGSGQPAYSGASTVLPLRAYFPGGASQISYAITNLTAISGGAVEYQIVAQTDGAGNYTLRASNGSVVAPAWPYPTMNASGSTVTLSTPIAVGALQITAYRFALAGNEFQLDLTVSRSDSFNDQIVILGVQGNNAAYSSPWNAVDGTWSGSSSGSPAVTLSSTSLNFGSQSVGASATQTLTITNSGSAALAISSAAVSGTNAGDFTLVNNCTSSVAQGGKCTIAVTFVPAASGARSATLTLTDNAAGSPHTVALSGTGSTSAMPTYFTTYLGTYGSAQPTYNGTSAVLPIRAYFPGGASQISYVITNLTATSGGAVEYQIVAQADGAGNYILRMTNGNGSVVAPAWPYPTMNASGNTVTLSTPITVGSLQITAYRFALAGNEFQLDLTVTRVGSFSDQIVIFSVQGNNAAYSSPWYGVNGFWTNP